MRAARPWPHPSLFCRHDMNTSSLPAAGVRFPGLIHPGLIGTAPSQELLDIWNEREGALVQAGPEGTTLGGVLHTRPLACLPGAPAVMQTHGKVLLQSAGRMGQAVMVVRGTGGQGRPLCLQQCFNKRQLWRSSTAAGPFALLPTQPRAAPPPTPGLAEPKGALLGKVPAGTPDWDRIAAEAARTVPGRENGGVCCACGPGGWLAVAYSCCHPHCPLTISGLRLGYYSVAITLVYLLG